MFYLFICTSLMNLLYLFIHIIFSKVLKLWKCHADVMWWNTTCCADDASLRLRRSDFWSIWSLHHRTKTLRTVHLQSRWFERACEGPDTVKYSYSYHSDFSQNRQYFNIIVFHSSNPILSWAHLHGRVDVELLCTRVIESLLYLGVSPTHVHIRVLLCDMFSANLSSQFNK